MIGTVHRLKILRRLLVVLAGFATALGHSSSAAQQRTPSEIEIFSKADALRLFGLNKERWLRNVRDERVGRGPPSDRLSEGATWPPPSTRRSRSARRDHRQEQIGLPPRPGVQRRRAPKMSADRSRGSSCSNGPEPREGNTARHVDEDCGRLHRAQLFLAEKAACLGRQRKREREIVCRRWLTRSSSTSTRR